MLTEFTPIMAGWYFLACHSENVKADPEPLRVFGF